MADIQVDKTLGEIDISNANTHTSTRSKYKNYSKSCFPPMCAASDEKNQAQYNIQCPRSANGATPESSLEQHKKMSSHSFPSQDNVRKNETSNAIQEHVKRLDRGSKHRAYTHVASAERGLSRKALCIRVRPSKAMCVSEDRDGRKTCDNTSRNQTHRTVDTLRRSARIRNMEASRGK